jgi:hypothetical protein
MIKVMPVTTALLLKKLIGALGDEGLKIIDDWCLLTTLGWIWHFIIARFFL